MKKKRVMAGILVGALAVGGHQVWAATVHYNDSSVTGGSAEWQAWTRQWEQLANDYIPLSVSLTMILFFIFSTIATLGVFSCSGLKGLCSARAR